MLASLSTDRIYREILDVLDRWIWVRQADVVLEIRESFVFDIEDFEEAVEQLEEDDLITITKDNEGYTVLRQEDI